MIYTINLAVFLSGRSGKTFFFFNDDVEMSFEE